MIAHPLLRAILEYSSLSDVHYMQQKLGEKEEREYNMFSSYKQWQIQEVNYRCVYYNESMRHC